MDAAELLAREALQRLNDLLGARDLAFADEFDPSSALLIGSEDGEVASGRAEMTRLLTSVYALPVRIGWEWDEVAADASGDVAWVYAEGRLAMAGDSGVERKPYRMSGVLQRSNDRWLWRLFHGSEPVQG
jgi:ketosteroid isomerase-like protein